MFNQAAAQMFLYFSTVSHEVLSSSSRLISYLLIVSGDLRVILISRPGCVFPPRNLFTKVDATLQSTEYSGDELFNGPMSTDVFMSHQSSYPLEPRNINRSRTMSQRRPDEEHPSNDDSCKVLSLST